MVMREKLLSMNISSKITWSRQPIGYGREESTEHSYKGNTETETDGHSCKIRKLISKRQQLTQKTIPDRKGYDKCYRCNF